MVRLFAVDTEALAPRFEALLERVEEVRRARITQFGNTSAGRRCLGAGLLLTRIAEMDALSAALYSNPYGKPYLSGQTPFNLSHAGGYAVLATAERAVGVDIERIRPIDHAGLSARFFHPDETAFLQASADPQADFFTLWTLKESFLKAEGCGFLRSPRTFAVLPDESGGAVPGWDTDYRFRRYDDFLPGYRLAACSTDGAFCTAVEPVKF